MTAFLINSRFPQLSSAAILDAPKPFQWNPTSTVTKRRILPQARMCLLKMIYNHIPPIAEAPPNPSRRRRLVTTALRVADSIELSTNARNDTIGVISSIPLFGPITCSRPFISTSFQQVSADVSKLPSPSYIYGHKSYIYESSPCSPIYLSRVILIAYLTMYSPSYSIFVFSVLLFFTTLPIIDSSWIYNRLLLHFETVNENDLVRHPTAGSAAANDTEPRHWRQWLRVNQSLPQVTHRATPTPPSSGI